MASDDFRLHAHFTDQCAEAQAQGLHAHEVELFLKQPARIIFTKTRRFDEGEGLIAQRVGGERGDGLWEHEGDFRWLDWFYLHLLFRARLPWRQGRNEIG